MQIIFGEPPEGLTEKYIVLELDTIQYAKDSDPITAYCVISGEQIALEEVSLLKQYADTHRALMNNYRKQNWSFCEQAIESLRGKFKGEMDSFYDILESRVRKYKKESLGNDWNGVLRQY